MTDISIVSGMFLCHNRRITMQSYMRKRVRNAQLDSWTILTHRMNLGSKKWLIFFSQGSNSSDALHLVAIVRQAIRCAITCSISGSDKPQVSQVVAVAVGCSNRGRLCPYWSKKDTGAEYSQRCPLGLRCPYSHGAKDGDGGGGGEDVWRCQIPAIWIWLPPGYVKIDIENGDFPLLSWFTRG